MLSDLSPEALALAEYMSSLSEKAWCAGWIVDLEFRLSAAIQGEKRAYGRVSFSAPEIAKLKSLSDACGGWIVFHETTEQTFVPLQDWSRVFSEDKSVRDSARQVERAPRSE
jgi:hypothetical protein